MEQEKSCRIAVIADIHYYSETLGCSGRAYELREGSDQKCLKESGAVADAAFQRLAEDTELDCVLIAGDLTDNGEVASHEEFREKLRAFARKKPVFVITSTHDWCSDGLSRRYLGDQVLHDAPVLPEDGLMSFYHEFGYAQALDTFETAAGNASYLVELKPGFLLLALNDDHNGMGRAGFTPAHLKWVVNHITQARARGDVIFGMCHHLMCTHASSLINGGQSQGEREPTLQQLADAGLRLVFTGHSHMQHIAQFASPRGNRLTEVNVGALGGYCAPMMKVLLTQEGAEIRTEKLREFTYRGRTIDAQPFLKKKLEDMVLRIIRAGAQGDKEEFLARMGAMGVSGKALSVNFGIIHQLCRMLENITVGKAVRLLNRMTFGKAVNAKGLEAVSEKKVLDVVLLLLAGLFDGEAKISPTSPLYHAVMDVATMPARCARRLPGAKKSAGVLAKVEALVRDLMDPPPPDNQNTTVLFECGALEAAGCS